MRDLTKGFEVCVGLDVCKITHLLETQENFVANI
jgi:hypothetical protein